MKNGVTQDAILLPDRRLAAADGAPLPASRWRIVGCTGTRSTDICFIRARIERERWYGKVALRALDGAETGVPVTLERSSNFPDEARPSNDSPSDPTS